METQAALRQQYHQNLEELRADVIRMGTRTNDLVKAAVDAILNGDIDLARDVIRNDDEIDRNEQEVHKRTVLIVMRESPVANDLRFLLATLGIVGEIEKAADDAVKLSRRAQKLSGHFPAEMRVALLELGEEARKMFTAAIRLYSDYSCDLATEIIASDKGVDTRYTQARDRVIELIQKAPENTSALIRTIDSFHALEHVADHAVEISRRLKMLYERPVETNSP